MAAVSEMTGLSIDYFASRVSHSRRRMRSRREIDIMLEVDGHDCSTALLIENKLDTAEQPKQAESYNEEAKFLVQDGRFGAAITVLVCPEQYMRNSPEFSKKFDCVISYERLRAMLQSRAAHETGEIAQRLIYRSELISQAIDKARRGYTAVPLAAVTNFTRSYVELLKELEIMLPPGPSMLKDAPSQSKTMIFAPLALPSWDFLPQTRLVHQLREANANICLYTWGDHFSHLAAQVGAALANTSYRVVPTINKRRGGRSGLMIVADTPAVDNLASFGSQRNSVEEGMRITAELANWFSDQEDQVRDWERSVASLVQ